MFDARRLLDQFIGAQTPHQHTATPTGGGFGAGGLAGGALAGGVMGLLLGSKSGRKLAKNAAAYGGMALLGGLAYKAYQDWQAGRQPGASGTFTGAGSAPSGAALEMPPEGSRFLPSAHDIEGANQLGLALIRAMIAAAKADGHIDAEEQGRIFSHLGTLELDPEEKAFVMDELARPLDLDAVVRGATSKETAVEIYAASLLAMEPDNPAERGYLAMLAGRLDLEPDLLEQVHAKVRDLADAPPGRA